MKVVAHYITSDGKTADSMTLWEGIFESPGDAEKYIRSLPHAALCYWWYDRHKVHENWLLFRHGQIRVPIGRAVTLLQRVDMIPEINGSDIGRGETYAVEKESDN